LAIGIISRIVAFQVTTYKAGASYYGKDDKIESKVYDSKGVLVKYNGQYLDGTRYKSNVIVQNSINSTVVEAANALFNKHPDTSIIVKFDQNGNLVTLKAETYTPTGDIRVNFVDHGADLTQGCLLNKALAASTTVELLLF
jgi:hypothetical protein